LLWRLLYSLVTVRRLRITAVSWCSFKNKNTHFGL
jgi:hypothetical protein